MNHIKESYKYWSTALSNLPSRFDLEKRRDSFHTSLTPDKIKICRSTARRRVLSPKVTMDKKKYKDSKLGIKKSMMCTSKLRSCTISKPSNSNIAAKMYMSKYWDGEKRICIKSVNGKVDGYDPVTKTIVQVHGCFWHGHGKCFQAHTIDQVKGVSMGLLFDQTQTQLRHFREAGFDVQSVWGRKVQQMIKNNTDGIRDWMNHSTLKTLSLEGARKL